MTIVRLRGLFFRLSPEGCGVTKAMEVGTRTKNFLILSSRVHVSVRGNLIHNYEIVTATRGRNDIHFSLYPPRLREGKLLP
jgi:hypothetical protein